MPGMPSHHPRLVYIVSSHGFGHAARACAVLGALARRRPGLRVRVVGQTPEWFFRDSLGDGAAPGLELDFCDAATDVGLAQTDALVEDLAATDTNLGRWWPAGPEGPPAAEQLALLVEAVRGAQLVVCDISPFGLAAARRAGVPSLLVENFTWDWIYRGYGGEARRSAGEPTPSPLDRWVEPMARLFALAGHRVQTTPYCDPQPDASQVAPVARAPRLSRQGVRRQLGIPTDEPMVLVTMGGIEWDYAELESCLGDPSLPWLVIPGGCPEPRRHGRCLRLPHRSDYYHPDLVQGADAVVGKLGYSTLAEVWSAGIPFAYVPRARFPESPPLETWVAENLPHRTIATHRFTDGHWLEDLAPLLALTPTHRTDPWQGADSVAKIILERLG